MPTPKKKSNISSIGTSEGTIPPVPAEGVNESYIEELISSRERIKEKILKDKEEKTILEREIVIIEKNMVSLRQSEDQRKSDNKKDLAIKRRLLSEVIRSLDSHVQLKSEFDDAVEKAESDLKSKSEPTISTISKVIIKTPAISEHSQTIPNKSTVNTRSRTRDMSASTGSVFGGILNRMRAKMTANPSEKEWNDDIAPTWTSILTETNDIHAMELEEWLDVCADEDVERLARVKTSTGRNSLQVASPKYRHIVYDRLIFFKKYRFMKESVLHMSKDMIIKTAQDMNSNKTVVLKFLRQREEFRSELAVRGLFDAKYATTVLDSFDGEVVRAFKEETQLKGLYPYCIVLKAFKRTLTDIMIHENISGQKGCESPSIIRSITEALAHVHSKGYIHGDVKADNVVRVKGRYLLTNFEASAAIGSFAGLKVSTAHIPPEMIVLKPKTEGTENHPNTEGFPVVRIDKREAVTGSRIDAKKLQYSRLPASTAFDIWSLGVLAFEILAGQPLFPEDREGNTGVSQLKLIAQWDDDFKEKRLSIVKSPIARAFLSKCLVKAEGKRTTTRMLLLDPFLAPSFEFEDDIERAEDVFAEGQELDTTVLHNQPVTAEVTEITESNNGMNSYFESIDNCIDDLEKMHQNLVSGRADSQSSPKARELSSILTETASSEALEDCIEKLSKMHNEAVQNTKNEAETRLKLGDKLLTMCKKILVEDKLNRELEQETRMKEFNDLKAAYDTIKSEYNTVSNNLKTELLDLTKKANQLQTDCNRIKVELKTAQKSQTELSHKHKQEIDRLVKTHANAMKTAENKTKEDALVIMELKKSQSMMSKGSEISKVKIEEVSETNEKLKKSNEELMLRVTELEETLRDKERQDAEDGSKTIDQINALRKELQEALGSTEEKGGLETPSPSVRSLDINTRSVRNLDLTLTQSSSRTLISRRDREERSSEYINALREDLFQALGLRERRFNLGTTNTPEQSARSMNVSTQSSFRSVSTRTSSNQNLASTASSSTRNINGESKSPAPVRDFTMPSPMLNTAPTLNVIVEAEGDSSVLHSDPSTDAMANLDTVDSCIDAIESMLYNVERADPQRRVNTQSHQDISRPHYDSPQREDNSRHKVRPINTVMEKRIEDLLREKKDFISVLERLTQAVRDLLAKAPTIGVTLPVDVVVSLTSLDKECVEVLQVAKESDATDLKAAAGYEPDSTLPGNKSATEDRNMMKATNSKSCQLGPTIQVTPARYRGRDKNYTVNKDGEVSNKLSPSYGQSSIENTLVESQLDRSSHYLNREAATEDISYIGFPVGTRVSARYGGNTKYFPGTIVRERLDGTYDIEYDAGEKEICVEEDLITTIMYPRIPAHSPSRTSRFDLSPYRQTIEETGLFRPYDIGTRVEARFGGLTTYYPGVIVRTRLNGTYDIEYDGGEKELEVEEDLISLPRGRTSFRHGSPIASSKRGHRRDMSDGTSPSRSSERTGWTHKDSVQLEVGAQVEARYRGRATYYPGTVVKANADGTYDIDYDDGEMESFVDRQLINIPDRFHVVPRSPSAQQRSQHSPRSAGFSRGNRTGYRVWESGDNGTPNRSWSSSAMER